MNVPFLDFTRLAQATADATQAAVQAVTASGRVILGPEVQAFEQAWAEACGVGHAVGVGSGTDALEIALRAFGVGPGDEVVTQANTCPPTASAIARTGARVVLCDVDEASGRIDLQSLQGALTERTKAVIPVHLYGQCADVAAVRAVLPDGVWVLEDCAQAHLATFEGRPAGAVGDAAAWSFYPSKNLGALGDAGATTTDDPVLADRMRELRQYGAFGQSDASGFGMNSRLDELQAAVLTRRLELLPAWTERRRAIASAYRDALAGTRLEPLELDPRAEHAYHLFVVRSTERDDVRRRLLERGVQTLVHYATPLHRLPAFAASVATPVSLARSELLCDQVLSLPLNPLLSDAEVAAVIEASRSVAAGGQK
ncbi:DegT/DnrJ/EryC1/StrS family aminotransferase [Solirubrobacter taibaiensis]|nr:DegT/DnrJ/EryC1/StrS family aminotransferase [Solirubrobacter taibaiensis]